ncbi:hypothetical protein L218DRAFT_895177 [Marasmius fiardii PR-910]|nr:hypothetical protein L218DRAFT_895177 [Marasmius fiardii PR-910]
MIWVQIHFSASDESLLSTMIMQSPATPQHSACPPGGQEHAPMLSDDDDEDIALQVMLAQKRKRSRHSQAVLSSDSEHEDPNFIPTKPKRVQRKKRKINDPDSKQLGFLELPIDVFFEIAKNLNPVDLLNLSRTNKALRNNLMNRMVSHSLWRESFENCADLPPLPRGMTEPAYANLLFSTKCHLCSAAVLSVFWGCRLRCCHKCMGEAFIDKEILLVDEQFSTLASNPTLLDMIPQRIPGVYLRSAVENFTVELNQVVGKQDFEGWCKSKREDHTAAVEHAKECQEWAKSQRVKRKAEISAIRTRRLERAKEKLSELGWGKEMDNREFLSHRFFHEKKEFSEAAFERAKKGLIERLNKVKNNVQQEVANVREQRYALIQATYHDFRSRHPSAILPSFGDLLLSIPISNLLERKPLDQNLNTKVVSSVINLNNRSFSSFVEKWRASKDLQLLQMLRNSDSSVRPHLDLSLATMVFRCNNVDCGQTLYYPDVLTHPCASSPTFRSSTEAEIAPGPSVCRKYGSDPWNFGGKRISFHVEASANARAILEACGLDPMVTKATHPALKNIVVDCGTCRDRCQDFGVFLGWPQVLDHLPKGEFSVCYKAQNEDAPPSGTNPQFPPEEPWVFGVRCVRCDHLSCPSLLFDHLAKMHGLTQPTKMDWCFDLSVKFCTNA